MLHTTAVIGGGGATFPIERPHMMGDFADLEPALIGLPQVQAAYNAKADMSGDAGSCRK